MRYVNLSTREARDVLMDYQATCEGAAFILAYALDNAEYRSPWFYVVFEEHCGFFIRIINPERHHVPTNQCPCKLTDWKMCTGALEAQPIETTAYIADWR